MHARVFYLAGVVRRVIVTLLSDWLWRICKDLNIIIKGLERFNQTGKGRPSIKELTPRL